MRRSASILIVLPILAATIGDTLAANYVVTPPQKIQQAIDLALTNGDKEDVIFVNPGVYDESLDIDYGSSIQTLLYIVHNTNLAPTITGGVTIQDSSLVTLDGFSIRSSFGDTNAAVRISNTVGAAIVQCQFAAGDFGGVDASNSYEVVVNTCKFGAMEQSGGQGGFGVRILGRCAHRVLDCTFKGDEGRSVWIEADRTDVQDCSVSQAGGDCGVYIEGLVNAVKKTTVKDGDNDGVRVVGVCDVNSCTLQNNGNVGLRIGLNNGDVYFGGKISKNTIKDNDSNGILVDQDQDGVDIRDNDVFNNSGAGIRLKADGCSVRDNNIQKTSSGGQGGHGVLVDTTSDRNCLRANQFKSNSGNAIVVEGDDNYLLLNSASDSDGYIDNGSQNAGRDNATKGTNQFG